MPATPAPGSDARRSWASAVFRVAARPDLWPTALVQLRRTIPPGWWRRPPFLPLPSRAYLHFRLDTQYGTAAAPDPHDVVTYLTWCRAMARSQRRGAGRRR